MSRRPTDPKLMAKAIDLCAREGCSPAEAAERLKGKVSTATIYRELEKRKKAAASGAPVEAARPSGLSGLAADVFAPAAPAGAVEDDGIEVTPPIEIHVKEVPKELRGVAARLWIVRQEIEAVRRQLAMARARGAGGTAALGEQLRKLLADEASLEPAPPPSEADEEARWKATADAVIAKIEAGVRRAEKAAA